MASVVGVDAQANPRFIDEIRTAILGAPVAVASVNGHAKVEQSGSSALS